MAPLPSMAKLARRPGPSPSMISKSSQRRDPLGTTLYTARTPDLGPGAHKYRLDTVRIHEAGRSSAAFNSTVSLHVPFRPGPLGLGLPYVWRPVAVGEHYKPGDIPGVTFDTRTRAADTHTP
jgi:hypothetical protein|eukprot:7387636-Prymnesium_polylepis.3